MSITVHSNHEHLSLRDYEAKIYSSIGDNPDWSVEERTEDKIANKNSLHLRTSYVQRWDNHWQKLLNPIQEKTEVWFISLKNEEILLISISKNYSDGMSQLYKKILSTLSF